MKAGKMPGLMCRSPAATAVCQSHASTAACVPADPRAVIAPAARRVGGHDVRYARLGEGRKATGGGGGDRRRAVTLPMVTKSERAQPKPKSKLSSASNAPASRATITTATTTTSEQHFQVVVMRVSLHCQGCAGKVKKHISKMEGVTSFSIDLESKRVTVMGHVSPVGVLESVSKVKKAEFWSTC